MLASLKFRGLNVGEGVAITTMLYSMNTGIKAKIVRLL